MRDLLHRIVIGAILLTISYMVVVYCIDYWQRSPLETALFCAGVVYLIASFFEWRQAIEDNHRDAKSVAYDNGQDAGRRNERNRWVNGLEREGVKVPDSLRHN